MTKSYRFAALLGPAVLLNPAPNGVVAAGTSIAATGEWRPPIHAPRGSDRSRAPAREVRSSAPRSPGNPLTRSGGWRAVARPAPLRQSRRHRTEPITEPS